MKKIIILAALIFAAVSCGSINDLKDIKEIQKVTTNVNVVTSSISAEIPRPDSYTVKFINYDEKLEIVKTTDASGKVSTSDIVPGVYTITVQGESAKGGFTYYFSGSETNTSIVSDNKSYNIELTASKAGALILKEIYFNGSTGYYFKDQFYEIYNNSNEVQYADGLCIATLMPATATTTTYQWEVGEGKNPDDYIYCGSVWQIPAEGNGKNYPVAPGESIIIAQIAQNHTVIKPTSPVDLSKAEFETFIKTQTVNPDNPESVNMTLKIDFNVFGTQWLVTVFGGAYVLFMPEADFDNATWVQPKGNATKAKEIPIDWVTDGVELVNNATKVTQKRMPASLDAGATYTGAAYTGKSVSRKIKSTMPDGRIVYMDTNNSSEDFQVNSKAVVRRNNAGAPSWSPASK